MNLKFTHFIFIFAMFSVNAANFDYKVDLLTEKNGFVTYNIYTIVQDHKGFIWFGTGSNELLRYDGENVNLVPHKLSSSGNLMLDSDNRIWIGTWGNGVEVFDLSSNHSISFSSDKAQPHSISGNRVQSLFQDLNGAVWLGTYTNGLNQFIPETRTFKHFNELSHDRIWGVTDADNESLWVATSYGLNLLNKSTSQSTVFLPTPENKNAMGWNVIRHVMVDSSKQVKLGTDSGLLNFDPKTQKFLMIKDKNGNDIGKVYSLIQDQNSNFWMGTSRGLYQYSNGDSHAVKFLLPNDAEVRIAFEDRSGVIWVSSKNDGIYKLTPNKKFHEVKNNLFKSPNSLSITNNKITVVTANAALIQIDSKTNKSNLLVENLIPSSIRVSSMDKSAKPILYQTSKNEVWFAQGSNILKYNLETRRSTPIKYDSQHSSRETFTFFKAISSDAKGNIWIGTYRDGLHIYNEQTKKFKHFMPSDEPNSLNHAEVLLIYRDNVNRMWVGTGKGLNLWDEQVNGFHQFLDDKYNPTSLTGHLIQSIYQDNKNRLWVGTKHGLNLYDEASGGFKLFSKKSGLASNWIRGIVDDDQGNIWISTSKGLSKLNPNTGEIINYDEDDGLLGVNYFNGGLVKGSQGDIFLSGPRGIDYFHPEKIETVKNDLRVVLTRFNKMGKPVKLNSSYPYVKNIELSYKDNFFSFQFAALDFIAPKKIKYSYQLENFDENWVDNKNSNIVSYTNLDSGKYTFKVKAARSNGFWSDDYLSINIVISSPPWETWWAYSLYIITTAFIIFAYIRRVTRNQKIEIDRQKIFVSELKKQVAKQTQSLFIEKEKLSTINKELEMQTFQDGLTGLYNRRYFDIALNREISRHQRDQIPFSLVMCDIDHFKAFNDFYGHFEGDNCLISVSQCLSDNVSRKNDYVCRYGGEEFAIILTNTNNTNAEKMISIVRSKINEEIIPHAKSLTCGHVTLSFGIYTLVPTRETTSESIIKMADDALYQSKENGRNQITII